MDPVSLMAAGTVMSMVGQYQANMAQAKAERQNAIMFQRQAEFALSAQFRQEDIARNRYSQMVGAQVSAYARGGVDISGSAAGTVVRTLASQMEELYAIKQKGSLEYALASARGAQSSSTADTLGSFQYNLLQGGSTALTNYAKYASVERENDSQRIPSSDSNRPDGASNYTLGGNYRF